MTQQRREFAATAKIRRAGLDGVDEVDTVDLSLYPSWDHRLDFHQPLDETFLSTTTLKKDIRMKRRLEE